MWDWSNALNPSRFLTGAPARVLRRAEPPPGRAAYSGSCSGGEPAAQKGQHLQAVVLPVAADPSIRVHREHFCFRGAGPKCSTTSASQQCRGGSLRCGRFGLLTIVCRAQPEIWCTEAPVLLGLLPGPLFRGSRDAQPYRERHLCPCAFERCAPALCAARHPRRLPRCLVVLPQQQRQLAASAQPQRHAPRRGTARGLRGREDHLLRQAHALGAQNAAAAHTARAHTPGPPLAATRVQPPGLSHQVPPPAVIS